ncbi:MULTISPECIES: hypothetical protein [unclassified Corallococcus]|uniref:hypothetical protein n=1 Tax=unclassified Corallococcus TaxID=2685029 RepID=UPI001A8D95CE|nr:MULTISPECIES: hypothetical protein [unclassified Corallococcus]MBN9683460.1 hypothetical protein [Corallococcus sp. NCSPR001]WAS85023.1 hypothetical protein O0N60_37920 [Corallococcus sp. NCRR]
MKTKTLIGGWMLAAGLLAGCGGTEMDTAEGMQDPAASQEQSLRPTCAAGYTSLPIWECPFLPAGAAPCRYSYGGYYNEQHLYCTNGTDTYDAGPTGIYACGDCY